MRVLVVASHPDDEILGCGGTIAKHVESGDEVFNLILAEGATSRQVKRDREKIAEYLNDLAKNAIEAGKVLGVKNVDLLNFPDNRLDSIDRIEIVKAIENKIKLLLKILPFVLANKLLASLPTADPTSKFAKASGTCPLSAEVLSVVAIASPPSILPSFRRDFNAMFDPANCNGFIVSSP